MKSPIRSPRKRKPKPDPWEHALTCPLPPTISYQLLNTLREHVITYLQFVTHDMVQGDLEGALHEIQRIADRLTRITAMTPRALAAAVDADLVRFRANADAERKAQMKDRK